MAAVLTRASRSDQSANGRRFGAPGKVDDFSSECSLQTADFRLPRFGAGGTHRSSTYKTVKSCPKKRDYCSWLGEKMS